MQRRRIKQTAPLNERLAEQAQRLRQEAKSLPPGIKRERAARAARQVETAIQISEWLLSPGLRSPV